MPDSVEDFPEPDLTKAGPVILVIFLVLCAFVLVAYRYASTRPSSIVLPNGVNYLGPTDSPADTPTPTVVASGNVIPVPSDATWDTHKGTKFPYSFLYPTTLSLGIFPGDEFDSVTIFSDGGNPSANIFVRVENLKAMEGMEQYVNKPKQAYAEVWWKQYNWKGVKSVEKFTNSKGLVGYRAKYLDDAGNVPFDNVFFEIPKRPELVLWIANKQIEQSVFDKMLDSMSWGM